MRIIFVFALGLLFCFSAPGQNPKLIPQPCEVPGVEPGKKDKALCAEYEVFEDRAAKKGRKIKLKVVIYPATGAQKAPDPVFHISGGPGSSATEDAPYVADELKKIRQKRDLVFLDQRGTGGSHPLNCTLFDAADPQSYLGHWNPPARIRKCREELEKTADLRLYTTTIAMGDLDEVRAALGYKKININSASYGTRATQEYLRRYGKSVRAVMLQGVSLTSQSLPRDLPQDNERALNGVVDECLADKDCRAAFPNLKAEVKAVLSRLTAGPVEVDIKNPADGKPVRARLSRDLAAEAVRYMMYSAGGASRMPLIIHQAAGGDFGPLAEAALFFRQAIVATGATGLYLSVTCAEDLPWIKPGEGERNAENTFLGDYRLRQQRDACAEWPRGDIPKDYFEPVRSDRPTLILTGEWDPVTPPKYGEALARTLTNSLHLTIPSGGHGFGGLDGLGCVEDISAKFMEQASVRGLDTACVKKIRRTRFRLPEIRTK